VGARGGRGARAEREEGDEQVGAGFRTDEEGARELKEKKGSLDPKEKKRKSKKRKSKQKKKQTKEKANKRKKEKQKMHPLHYERFSRFIQFGPTVDAQMHPLFEFGADPSIATLVAAKDNW
jgi:hypothetical protein